MMTPARFGSIKHYKKTFGGLSLLIVCVFNTLNAVIPYMKARKGGRIITLSSIGGRQGVVANGTYGTTKWAVLASDQARFVSGEVIDIALGYNASYTA
ncbi:hypothetical protein NIES2101_42200 [Calothrix sp. HK-06]|nr:hypothetical protein NIES2101_42200 [Calothrix sp. HK-06]